MRLVDKHPEVFEDTTDERFLSAARDDTNLDAVVVDLLHEGNDTGHDRGLGEFVEDATLDIVHTLGLSLVDLPQLLSHDHLPDGVYASGPFGGIGIIGGHPDTELCHRLLPGNGVVRHGVVEYAVHVKEHGFGAECLKAVSFQVLFNRDLVH